MTTEPQKKTVELIGETSPYLFDNANEISFNERNIEFPLHKSFEYFDKENFSNLIKILSTVGSLNLANQLKANKKNYFLGEKLRIRKISYMQPSGLLIAKVTPQLENEKKGKSLIEIMDENNKIFQMEIDYFIIDDINFKKIFEPYYHAEKNNDFNSLLPNTQFECLTEDEFNITVDEFTRSHCSGHFDNYNIVPAVFMTNIILKNIYKINSDSNIELDNLEILSTGKAMPVNTVFKVNIKIFHLSKKLKFYKCTVQDNKNDYGHYLLTFKNLS
ncbi:hypothetical protein OA93_23095 [Flavobacterium sp. KMS]|uniref:hypothetical protein n=1 Tax=Flavobacterium sp. KMS TaxID=1566023 RepID=UPI0005801667|nr:hypothetical protein [Flavobacterium sp. KMS]KIA92690.1 hypothetical protein OA93_23095 [Flavobacterium sp. KMS]